MRIATLNMWNTQGPEHRYREVLPLVLGDCKADIVLLQEVGFDGSAAPQSSMLARLLGFMSERYFFSGVWMDREEGLAILARFPMQRQYVRTLPDALDGMGRIVCGATLVTPEGPLDVFTTHLAFPLNAEDDRERQAVAALEFMRTVNPKLSARPLICGGDFNDEPESRPTRVFSEGAGLRDALSGVSSSRRLTFSSRNPYARPDLGTDRCIDHLFLSESLRVLRAELFGFNARWGEFASDHLGICCDFQVK